MFLGKSILMAGFYSGFLSDGCFEFWLFVIWRYWYLAILLSGFLSYGCFLFWLFVKWRFFILAFCHMAFFYSGFLSYGYFWFWLFVIWLFLILAFCQMANSQIAFNQGSLSDIDIGNCCSLANPGLNPGCRKLWGPLILKRFDLQGQKLIFLKDLIYIY